MQKIALSIPAPCHEDWQHMSATEQGRYCSSCKKEVVDFTLMTDKEIVYYLNKEQGNTCGSFLPQQLDRQLVVTGQSSFSWKYFFQILLPVVLFWQRPHAQDRIGLMKNPLVNIMRKPGTEVRIVVGMTTAKTNENFIRGVVLDGKTNAPIPFATIQIKESGGAVFSDSTGVFMLKNTGRSKRLKLIVSSVGYDTKEIVIPVNETRIIKLLATPVKMGEVIIRSEARRMGSVLRCTSVNFLRRTKDSLLRKNSFSFYPNPVNRGSVLNLNMKGVEKGEYLLQLVISDGKVIQQETIQVPDEKFIFGLKLNSEIKAGIYFLRIISPDKRIFRVDKVFIQ